MRSGRRVRVAYQWEKQLSLTAVIPAYNEGERLRGVLDVLLRSREVDEIIVVSDGSTDDTCEVARSFDGVVVVELNENVGKGGAMVAGARQASSEFIAFLDADLLGMTPDHFEALTAPVLSGEADMAIGVFKGGRPRTDWAQVIAPFISGQRVMRREDFLSIPELEATRYGVEVAITGHARRAGLRIRPVTLLGMTHPMKEEKIGFIPGTLSRLVMYWDILRIACIPRRRRSKAKSRKLEVRS